MNADTFLITLVAVESGALVVAIFVAINAMADRNRLARKRDLDNQRRGAHG